MQNLRYKLQIKFKRSSSDLIGEVKTMVEVYEYINELVDDSVDKVILFDRASNDVCNIYPNT